MASSSLPQNITFTLPATTDFSNGFTLYDKEIIALGTILLNLNYIVLNFHKYISTLPEIESLHNKLCKANQDLQYAKEKLGIPNN